MSTSLRTDVELQTVDGDDAASLAGGDRHRRRRCAPFQMVPRSSARPCPPGAMSDDGIATSPTSESTASGLVPHPQAAEQRLAEQPQRDDRHDREEQPLDPRRSSTSPASASTPDDDGGDAEEDDEEAARRRQLDGGEHQAEGHPHPPGHARECSS